MIKILEPVKKVAEEVRHEVVEGLGESAKKQIFGASEKSPETNNQKVSEVTGKPIPTKRAVSRVATEADQLQQIKLKQLRERLDEMRLQVEKQQALVGQKGKGPELPPEKPKPAVDVLANIKRSQETGEYKGGGG